ncbi:MAG TPA: TIGR03118 family protein [Candidatus Acidoferrum sp.]|nr:TIGR03118 family protein [Candidatus Acidoferrum sp.]
MQFTRLLKFFALSLFLLPAVTQAQHYKQTDLVSNVPGRAPVTDPNLQNAWGLVASPGSPWWVANNAGGTSTLYSSATTPTTVVPLVVTIPNAPSQLAPGSPTGVMFNGTSSDFLLDPRNPASHAIFLFVTEDGTVQGWNPGINLSMAVIKVDNSQTPDAKNGAVYKGATIADIGGKHFLLAANFRSGRIDVFDSSFKQVSPRKGDFDDDAFDDDRIPKDFAPFNVQGVGPNIYVTYAKQNAAKHDPVGGEGFGFVDVYTPKGKLLQRLQHGPWLNAPWGIVWATPNFGEFSNTILVGNFRGGTISAYNPVTGRFLGNMLNPDGTTLNIDGLWALRFGSGIPNSNSAPGSSLFFTAGPDGEVNGLFGTLTPISAELGEADEQ